jgi:hypothetical protein
MERELWREGGRGTKGAEKSADGTKAVILVAQASTALEVGATKVGATTCSAGIVGETLPTFARGSPWVCCETDDASSLVAVSAVVAATATGAGCMIPPWWGAMGVASASASDLGDHWLGAFMTASMLMSIGAGGTRTRRGIGWMTTGGCAACAMAGGDVRWAAGGIGRFISRAWYG